MKNIILFVLLCFASISTLAVEMTSQVKLDLHGELQKDLIVTCQPQEFQFCTMLCDNSSSCQIKETLCEDCITQKSQLMYSVFTNLHSYFKTDLIAVDQNLLLYFLKNKNFITIPYDFFMNMFTPEKKEILKKEFEELCYLKIENASLVITIDKKNQPEELVGVICQHTQGSVVLPVSVRIKSTYHDGDFWGDLQNKLEPNSAYLKLKISSELSGFKN